MTVLGHVRNGIVVPKEPLPEGAEVRIEVVPAAGELPTLAERFEDVIGKATGLPADMAENHDHYLHGLPKRAPQ